VLKSEKMEWTHLSVDAGTGLCCVRRFQRPCPHVFCVIPPLFIKNKEEVNKRNESDQ
jgi:hypothetical protein